YPGRHSWRQQELEQRAMAGTRNSNRIRIVEGAGRVDTPLRCALPVESGIEDEAGDVANGNLAYGRGRGRDVPDRAILGHEPSHWAVPVHALARSQFIINWAHDALSGIEPTVGPPIKDSWWLNCWPSEVTIQIRPFTDSAARGLR